LPHRINRSGRWWAAFAIAFGLLAASAMLSAEVVVRLTLMDHWILERIATIRADWLTRAAKTADAPASGWGLQAIWLANLVPLVIWRRWRHLIVWLAVGFAVLYVSSGLANLLQRPRPVGIEILGSWSGYASPSVPLAMLSAFLVSTAYALVPAGRPRDIAKILIAFALVVVTAARLYLAVEGPTDSVFGIVIGVAVSLVGFRLFVPNDVFPVSYRRGRTAHLIIDDRRRAAIDRAMLDQLGLVADEVKPFGLEGSGGSTPLRIKVKAETDRYVFGKLYAVNHLRSDRWYKLGRTLLYGRLEDEKAFNTVRRLVQYEDYVLRLLYENGLPVPRPYGIVELTPEREYLLVTEFFDGATEIGAAEVDDDIIDQGLLIVRRLWECGMAHRDIKPANLLVRDGRLLLIDSAFGQLRPSPWRQAVDLANMMLVLGLRTSAERVYAHARRYFDDEELAEAFAATRGLTMPTQLRSMLRTRGHDLHARFLELLPYRVAPIRIQRWSLRRTALTLTILVVGLLAGASALSLVVNPPL
jgi:tRNA A-37 threonylcarbamoyl transferase component Bud32